jgi:uncharacterized protein YaaR (DUF327 family)
MRKIILFTTIISSLFFISCSSGNKTVSYSEDKAFYDVLKKLNKKPADPALRQQGVDYFNQAVKQHQDRITAYRISSELNRYDKIIAEYITLQRLGDDVRASSIYREVNAANYFNEIQSAKEEAAAAYYNSGLEYMDRSDKHSAYMAYDMFRKSQQYVSGYKDASVLMKEAYEKSIVNIVINQPRDNSFYGNWNSNDYRTMYLDEQLARDLGGPYASGISARFYTSADVRRRNIQPDWMVDIFMDNMYQQPMPSRYSRNISRQIQVGSDTSGKPIMQTVKATLHITRYEYPGNNSIEYRVTDVETNESIAWDKIPLNYNRNVETATYSGDSRALSPEDWSIVNNSNMPIEGRQFSQEAYNRFLNNLKSRIRSQLQ